MKQGSKHGTKLMQVRYAPHTKLKGIQLNSVIKVNK